MPIVKCVLESMGEHIGMQRYVCDFGYAILGRFFLWVCIRMHEFRL